MNSRVVFASDSDEYETPDDLFESLDSEFHFTLDEKQIRKETDRFCYTEASDE